MSSLTLPPHWKFNFPLLMGHLKKSSSGHLLRTDPGHLVNDCAEIVSCCIADPLPGNNLPQFTPLSVTVPSSSGCCAALGATYILTQSPTNGCVFTSLVEFEDPASPCDNYTCVVGFNGYTLKSINIVVSLSSVAVSGYYLLVDVNTSYQAWNDLRPGIGCISQGLPIQFTARYRGQCVDRTLPFIEYVTPPPTDFACAPSTITIAE